MKMEQDIIKNEAAQRPSSSFLIPNSSFHRTVIPEWMDQPDAQPEELIEDLNDLVKLNRFGWGAGLVWECVRKVMRSNPAKGDWTLLDIATGSADIPRYLVDWARRNGISLRVTATDLHPVTLNFAREQSRDYPEVDFETANLISLQYADNSFDIVTCSQALHHFGSEEIVTALRHMGRIARRAVIVSDLVRSKWGEMFVSLAIHLGGGGRFARHDGPASMRNGFKLWEMDRLACQAGLNRQRHFRHRGLRFAMTWMKKLDS
jgi:SAM-dependent methyltransferase